MLAASLEHGATPTVVTFPSSPLTSKLLSETDTTTPVTTCPVAPEGAEHLPLPSMNPVISPYPLTTEVP